MRCAPVKLHNAAFYYCPPLRWSKLKIKPTLHPRHRTAFRQGIVTGDKAALYPILEWTLRRLPELRKRAYLARFLVKVELHPEVEGDSDLVRLYAQVGTFGAIYSRFLQRLLLVHI